jgi:hypothetical protein
MGDCCIMRARSVSVSVSLIGSVQIGTVWLANVMLLHTNLFCTEFLRVTP